MKLNMLEELYFELPTDTEWMEIPENSPLGYEVGVDFYKWNTNKAVIIIVGKWGTAKGYENKYVTIASWLVKKYWVNVFVVENPWISRDDPELFFDSAINFVNEKMKYIWFEKYKSFVMGFSAWWHFVWRFSYKYSEIEKILLVNPVLRVDFEKLKTALLSFKWWITIVQWNKDTDYQFNPLLSQIINAKIEVLEWVDHQFTNDWGIDLFISLPEKYLFD